METVRRHIRTSFGPEPAKTPLNTRITGIIERPDYRIEKCLFESRPGFLVTANLYVPKHEARCQGSWPLVGIPAMARLSLPTNLFVRD